MMIIFEARKVDLISPHGERESVDEMRIGAYIDPQIPHRNLHEQMNLADEIKRNCTTIIALGHYRRPAVTREEL